MTDIVVETRDLTKIYGDGADVHALDGVTLTVHAGEFIAIVGPSGSGKSTLLNMIGALDRPTSGEVIINGTPISKVKDLDHFRGKTIGFVFQTHNLIPTLTARENVEVPMHETALSGSQRRARADELLELVGLGKRRNFLPNQMSGGERQRVAVARALANHPVIILADEPTGNLDSKTTEEIMALFERLHREHNTTMIVVTHNTQVARATNRMITIRDGKIQKDVSLMSAIESDLIDFKSSALGQAILRGENGGSEEVAALVNRLKEMMGVKGVGGK
jgi:ABC-type lipoprotein export system ATPase subunit